MFKSKKALDQGHQDSREQRMREMRQVQIWGTERFRAEAHCQSLAVAQSKGEREDQTFIEAITDCDLT